MKNSSVIVLILAGLMSGCASVRPQIKCVLATGRAEVYQGIAGIGTSQDLPEADKMCARPAGPN